MRAIPPEQRFWKKVHKTEGCWLWTGYTVHGYGRLDIGQVPVLAHRFAYELLVGPIPGGLTLDHLCHNADAACTGGATCPHRACVNPAHLQPATHGENISRGRSGAFGRAKTHCPQGHPYNEANTGWKKRPRGVRTRYCLACARKYMEGYRVRVRKATP